MFWFGSFSIWIISIILAGLVGARKDATGLGLITGVFLGPLGVLIILASRGNLKDCAFCKEWIKFRAVVCPHCGRDLPKHEEPTPSVSLASFDAKQYLPAGTARYFLLAVAAAITTFILLRLGFD